MVAENNVRQPLLSSSTESIGQSIDNGKFGCGILSDLEKAFDTVNCAVLFDKSETMCLNGRNVIYCMRAICKC